MKCQSRANDLSDTIMFAKPPPNTASLVDKCSAFLKRVGHEIIVAHNTWMGFLPQTMTMTLAINGEHLTVNAATPGLIGSGTDFGYNNKGIMFNETTHRMAHSVVKPDGVWIFWRAALAEQFSASIDDFFRYISIDNTGTYLNGYMLTDAKSGETGLVEMSYRCFIYYRSAGGAYSVSSKSLDGQACSTEYDAEMVTPDHLLGINYPASIQIRADLQSQDNRPARAQPHNAVGLDLHAVQQQAGSGRRPERDDRAAGHESRMRHPREGFLIPLHPQTMQTDADQFCGKLAAFSNENLGLRGTDRRRVVGRLGKASDLA
jgi:hypothetical protein